VAMPVLVGGFIILAGGLAFIAFYRVPKRVDSVETSDQKAAIAAE